ncbi:DUF1449 family protein [Simiduia curdlanivorans]|uniref:OB-fold-containig protein n=1 Tax=Simiduia curdlanivorans TaxID=1492769 RepID=A0ABV8V0L2_9GAMM|nr:OB-fold-containig protein [Simiduia curdlanivorans]MDN3637707.1 DUF1449 family protein [Simiduia curdlanivorans]
MFAILLSDKMDPFYQNLASFPTAIFSFFLILCLLYWLVAVLGFVDIDMLDFDVPDMDGDLDINADSSHSTPDVLAALMLKFGLQGVPVTIIVSLIALFGWLVCYYLVHFLFGWVPDGFLRYLLGLPVLFASLYAAVMITSQVIKPLRPLFKNARQQTVQFIIGQTAVVRSSVVNSQMGEAILSDGGAGLLLKVRSEPGVEFVKGDRVVLLEHEVATNIYKVISEAEFSGN